MIKIEIFREIVLKIYNIQAYQNQTFKARPPKVAEEIVDLKVFYHHIYEYKKGIRNLILTTENSKYKDTIEQRLKTENIDYLIHDVAPNKINVFFGAKQCVEVIKTFNPKLNEITAEQDFILGILLGYDRVRQCERYMKIKNNEINVGKKSL